MPDHNNQTPTYRNFSIQNLKIKKSFFLVLYLSFLFVYFYRHINRQTWR